MNISIAVVIFLLTVFASISLNGIMRNIAKNNRWLIDIPDKNRKFHLNSYQAGRVFVSVKISLRHMYYTLSNTLNTLRPLLVF